MFLAHRIDFGLRVLDVVVDNSSTLIVCLLVCLLKKPVKRWLPQLTGLQEIDRRIEGRGWLLIEKRGINPLLDNSKRINILVGRE